MKFEITHREVLAGERMPKWYGRAYHRCEMDVTVCYPIPINLLVRWFDKLKWWVICPLADREELAYQRGYNDGRRDELNRQWDSKILAEWPNDSS